jgi:hypothetical protein
VAHFDRTNALKLLIALLVVVAILAVFFACLLLFGFLMDRLGKDVDDPDLGRVKIGFASCTGKIALESAGKTAFSLPVAKRKLVPEAKAILLKAKADWPRLQALLLEHFAREVVEEGVPPDTIQRTKWVEKIARERDFENLQRFTKLDRIIVEYSEKKGPLQLRISTLHRWDPEHDRVLVLDEELSEKFYALGCER